jgi:hypothetical protein
MLLVTANEQLRIDWTMTVSGQLKKTALSNPVAQCMALPYRPGAAYL